MAYTGPGDVVTYTAWYGLRAYSASAAASTVNAVTVRRASDNSTQTIKVTTAGGIDTATLNTFLASTTGYVTEWYDQTGNGYNISQSTAADQAQVFATGGFSSQQPYAAFSGSNIYLLSTALANTQPLSMSVVAERTGNTSSYQTVFGTTNTGGAGAYGILFANTTNTVRILIGGGGLVSQTANDNAWHVLAGVYNNSVASYIVADNSSASGTPGAGSGSSIYITIGCDAGGGSGENIFTGNFCEGGLETGTAWTSTNWGNLYTNQYNYWSVAPPSAASPAWGWETAPFQPSRLPAAHATGLLRYLSQEGIEAPMPRQFVQAWDIQPYQPPALPRRFAALPSITEPIPSLWYVTPKIITITSNQTWVVPSDWNNSANTIQLWGPGGNSAAGTTSASGGAGGSGGFSQDVNLALTPGTGIGIVVGAAGSGTATTFNSTTIVANAGGNASGTTGGSAAAAGTGQLARAGTAGANGASALQGGAGGTGAPGPLGLGAIGGTGNLASPGGGGGGADGGSAGASASSGGHGGNGGNNASGTGSGAGATSNNTPGSAGTLGGGGGGGQAGVGAAGGQGSSAASGAGSGGGGGGGSAGSSSPGGAAQGYGSSGGGGGYGVTAGGAAGPSTGGAAVITYTPAWFPFQQYGWELPAPFIKKPAPEHGVAQMLGSNGIEQPFTPLVPVFEWALDPGPLIPRMPWRVLAGHHDGNDLPMPRPFVDGWAIPPHQPQHPRPEIAGAIMPQSIIDAVFQQFYPPDWEVQAFQPSHPRTERAGAIAVNSVIDALLHGFVPDGWEIPPYYLPHPRSEKSGALPWGDQGAEAVFNFFQQYGWELAPAFAAHPHPERGAGLFWGDQGNEAVFIPPPTEVRWTPDTHGFVLRRPPLIVPGWHDGIDAPLLRFRPTGWEVPPFQPGHPRPERAGALFGTATGIEAVLRRFFPYGWEIAPHQPPHPRTEKAAALTWGDIGTQAKFIPPVFVFVPWAEGVAFQPSYPRWSRAGVLGWGDQGIEWIFFPVPPPPIPTPNRGLLVVGDYRNGALYVYDLNNQLDNNQQRRWVRTWRAFQRPVDEPVRFASLQVDMETGSDVPSGTAPQVVLRWSDDGGHSWSYARIMNAGPPGATSQRVIFRRLGSTKLNSGLDRIFELSSTDQFKVALIGAILDPE